MVPSLCWPTDSNTEQVTDPTLFSLSDGTGMVVASATPESPKVLNDPETIFHGSDEHSFFCVGMNVR